MPITLDNLDAAFTYHPWSEDQVAKGKPIRAAAKAAAKAVLELQKSVCDLHSAIDASAPVSSDAPKSELALTAKERRKLALAFTEKLIQEEIAVQGIISALGQIVMIANAAITFEAAELQPMDPAEAHSERAEDGSVVVKATIQADVSAEDAVKILEPVISHLTGGENKDERPQVTD